MGAGTSKGNVSGATPSGSWQMGPAYEDVMVLLESYSAGVYPGHPGCTQRPLGIYPQDVFGTRWYQGTKLG